MSIVRVCMFPHAIKLIENDPQLKKYGQQQRLKSVCVNNRAEWMYAVVNVLRRAGHYRINPRGIAWNQQSVVVFLSVFFLTSDSSDLCLL